jgi:nitroreductase
MLSVTEAIVQRHSVRAFLSTPVERATIAEILTLAARAPSGGNLQPWHVDVVAGTALEP